MTLTNITNDEFELGVRANENKVQLTRIRDKKHNFVLCEFQNVNVKPVSFIYYVVYPHVLFNILSQVLMDCQ